MKNYTVTYRDCIYADSEEEAKRRIFHAITKSMFDQFVTVSSEPNKKEYYERVRKLINDIRKEVEIRQETTRWDDYRIIDYPLEETVAVKTFGEDGKDTHIHFFDSVLRRHNCEVRLIKPVKGGIIYCYHFND